MFGNRNASFNGAMGSIGRILQGGNRLVGGLSQVFGMRPNRMKMPGSSDPTKSTWSPDDINMLPDRMGDMADSASGFLGGLGGSIGGRFGRGLQKAGGITGSLGDATRGAGAMINSGRGLYDSTRGRMGEAQEQFKRGDYSGIGANIGGGVKDAMGFGKQVVGGVGRAVGGVRKAVGKGSRR